MLLDVRVRRMVVLQAVHDEVSARVNEHGRHGRVAGLEGGCVRARLECRAGLTATEAGNVELTLHLRRLAVSVVARADIRDDLARLGVDRNERAVVDVEVLAELASW